MTTGTAPGKGVAVATVGDEASGARLADALERSGSAVVHRGPTVEELPDGVDAVVLALGELGPLHVEALRALRARRPGTAAVVVAPVAERRAVREAFHQGLDGLVLEGAVDTALAPVVTAACAGGVSFPKELGDLLGKPVRSSREKQVLGMVVLGFSNAEIAGKLHLSESTVKSHLSSAFTKLGVRSRAAAASLILDPRAGFGAGILSITDDAAGRPRPASAPSA